MMMPSWNHCRGNHLQRNSASMQLPRYNTKLTFLFLGKYDNCSNLYNVLYFLFLLNQIKNELDWPKLNGKPWNFTIIWFMYMSPAYREGVLYIHNFENWFFHSSPLLHSTFSIYMHLTLFLSSFRSLPRIPPSMLMHLQFVAHHQNLTCLSIT
jgi:hypothetical protein